MNKEQTYIAFVLKVFIILHVTQHAERNLILNQKIKLGDEYVVFVVKGVEKFPFQSRQLSECVSFSLGHSTFRPSVCGWGGGGYM